MPSLGTTQPEETLDPQDWPAMRALGHRMLDDMFDYLEHLRDGPVWQPLPEEVRERFRSPLPLEPEGAEQAYADFKRDVLPYNLGNTHPRFWGWVMGPGTVVGMLAELLAAAINPNLGGGDHAPNYVEAQVLDWCKTMVGFPPEASGVLVSGGATANLIALTIARQAKAGFDVRRQGLQQAPRRLMVYCSQETHNSNQKMVELLGLGSDSLRLIPVDHDFRVEVGALEQAIAADRAAGHLPICVIGCAATTNTGSIDDLPRLAEICQREGLWFHVDGAFGALAALDPETAPLVAGMERADSLAFDLHKWFYLPFDIGVTLTRHAQQHLDTFALHAAYLTHSGARGIAAGRHWFTEYSFETSRRFRALKAWMVIKAHGSRQLGRLVRQNVEQARYLGALVDQASDLENLAPVALNVVNFRFKAGNLDDEALNRLNDELLIRLHESGVAAPSLTNVRGQSAIRVAITNHRSRREDFDLLIHEVQRLGHELLQ